MDYPSVINTVKTTADSQAEGRLKAGITKNRKAKRKFLLNRLKKSK